MDDGKVKELRRGGKVTIRPRQTMGTTRNVFSRCNARASLVVTKKNGVSCHGQGQHQSGGLLNLDMLTCLLVVVIH
jgi:hypothetical protein